MIRFVFKPRLSGSKVRARHTLKGAVENKPSWSLWLFWATIPLLSVYGHGKPRQDLYKTMEDCLHTRCSTGE